MKNRSYYLTDTGVRIPKRKIKWVSSRQDEPMAELDLLSPRSSKFPSLFIQNINVLFQTQTPSASADIIEIKSQEGGVSDEN